MKSWLKFVCAVFIVCSLPTAGIGAPATTPSTGPTRMEGQQMGSPLAEMLFYEAAEQAVEDSYATIIPDSADKTDTEKAEKNQPAPEPDTPDAEAVKQNQ